MLRRSILSAVLAVLMMVGFASATYARGFDAIGARGNGMGGAGVGLIDDENAGQWNPANLGLPSATRGYEEDYATSLGLQGGAQVQSTNNFLENSQDLVDFFDDNDQVFNGDYSNQKQAYELFSIVEKLQRDNQGALLNGTVGFNSRHTNWSLSVNNITDAAAFTEIDPTGGLNLPDNDVQEGLADGNTNNVNGSFSSTYQQAANSCEQSFQKGTWNPGDFGFTGTTKNGLANKVAELAESNSVSVDDTKRFCRAGNQVLDQSVGGTKDDTFDTEDQRIIFEGASINEASFSYAKPEPLASIAGAPLYVGGSVRLMQGEVAHIEGNPFNVDASDSTDEVFDEEEDLEESTDFGVDIGLSYDARETMGVKVGLVGKYLNEPEFDRPDTGTVSIEPQVRLGLSAYPLDFMPVDVGSDWWQISADYDLTSNETLLQDYKKKYLSIGNEFNLVNSFWWNLGLRAGVRKNLEEDAEGNLYTGGLGLRMAGLNVEVSGVISDETTQDEDGEKQPTLAGGFFNLAYRF